MASLTACATCRLRALIRTQALARQGRQWFSYTPLRRQDEQAGEYVDTLLAKFDKSLNQQPKKRFHAQRGVQHVGNVRQGRVETPRRGRYSGLPLQQLVQENGGQPWETPAQRRGQGPTERRRDSRTPQRSQALIEDLAAPHRRTQAPWTDESAARVATATLGNAGPREIDMPKGTKPESTIDPYLMNATRKALPEDMVKAGDEFLRLARHGDPVEAWRSLQDMVKSSQSIDSMRKLGQDRHFNRMLFYYTIKITDLFVDSERAEARRELPSPATLLSIRTATTEKSSTIWPYLLWGLAQNAAKAAVKCRTTGDEFSHAEVKRLLPELMTAWSLCLKSQQQRGRQPPQLATMEMLLEPPDIDFSSLPNKDALREASEERWSSYSLAEALDFLVMPLTITSQQKDFDYPSAALVSLDLARTWTVELDLDCKGWVELMEIVVRSANDTRSPKLLARTAHNPANEQFREYFMSVMKDFDERSALSRSHDASIAPSNEGEAEETSLELSHPLLESLDRPAALTVVSSDFDRFVNDANIKLRRALTQNRLATAKRVWQSVKDKDSQFQSMQTPHALYETLLVTFLALRDHQVAIEVWQAMLRAGHQPTVKTCSIVMQGCRWSGDAPTMDAFWNNMRKAGIQPDAHAWSTRVFCFIRSREIENGLRALTEMSEEWIAVARQRQQRLFPTREKSGRSLKQQTPSAELVQEHPTDLHGVPRPNAVVMNSAVSALAMTDESHIAKVLSWAHAFGIEPDLTTYNVLLNVTMRCDKPTEALHILRRMDAKGIQPNSTTWTVLLTALFERGMLDDLDHAAQQEKVLSFISSLEAANAANIDAKGYALIIDRLLKNYSNPTAADAVLQHMSSRKVKPTPHIYTILMTAHFASSPPNFAAIESLWHSIRGANVPLDSQFYDRMIEGYATHHSVLGSTRPMMFFLHRMQHEGKKASWTALTAAVRALAARGEWERVRGLVGRVKIEVSQSRASRMRFGQREFWGTCVGLGVVRREEVEGLTGEMGR